MKKKARCPKDIEKYAVSQLNKLRVEGKAPNISK